MQERAPRHVADLCAVPVPMSSERQFWKGNVIGPGRQKLDFTWSIGNPCVTILYEARGEKERASQ